MTSLSRLFDGSPESVGMARRFARLVLAGHGLVDTVELVISELATNAVEHSASGGVEGSFVVELQVFGDHVEVAVTDMGSEERPELSVSGELDDSAEDGRGLFIVRALSKEWGSERVRLGLRVWADIA